MSFVCLLVSLFKTWVISRTSSWGTWLALHHLSTSDTTPQEPLPPSCTSPQGSTPLTLPLPAHICSLCDTCLAPSRPLHSPSEPSINDTFKDTFYANTIKAILPHNTLLLIILLFTAISESEFILFCFISLNVFFSLS